MKITVISALLLTTTATSGLAQEAQTFAIPLSRPGEIVRLDVDLMSGTIEVRGEDRDDVEVRISGNGESKRRVITPTGAVPIPVSSYGVEIEERDNRVSVDSDWRSSPLTVTVLVPRRANLDLDVTHSARIDVENVTGALELNAVHGPIRAAGIRGTVVAETVHGGVDVELLEVTGDQAMAFTTVHGDVSIGLPNNFAGEFTLKSRQDEIYSDFEVDIQPTEPTISRGNGDSGFRVELDQAIVLTTNGGGIPVRAETLHGTISLKKAGG